MRLDDIAQATIGPVIARFARRLALLAAIAVLTIVTLYYASAAATLALAVQYGSLAAYMIMAGVYATLALTVFVVFHATRPKAVPAQEQMANALSATAPRNMQIAMIVEAVMLGYTLARKSRQN